MKASKRNRSSELELKLDELRKELSAVQGGIFPHSVLSTQQIRRLSSQRPITMKEVTALIPTSFYVYNTLLLIQYPLIVLKFIKKQLLGNAILCHHLQM